MAASGSTTIANLLAKISLDASGIQKDSDKTAKMMANLGNVIAGGFATGMVAVKALEKGLQMITKGIGTAFKALTGLIGDSKKAYASYEQLAGGVDTLFKGASARVKDYANEAYKTAGLSANQYMETVTSFSASLIQSLGGNTGKAADYANRAIVDMSDNANKMGTDMSSIQNAYQGFAKQNYTMLDNLKLGYGGTKEEMARLIQDAAAMTETQKELGVTVDANSMSFANIVNAISVVQHQMGIAGATSAEAAGTIEGSTKALTAAWENVKISFGGGGQDIQQAFENLGNSLSAWLENAIPRIGEVMGNIGDALVTVIPGLGDKMLAVIPSIVPKFVAGGLKLAIGIVKGIGQGVKVLWQLLREIWSQLGQMLSGLGLRQLGENLMKQISNGIEIGWDNFLAWLYGALGRLVGAIETWINDKLGKLAEVPVLKELFKDMKQVDLGASALEGKAADRRAQADKLQQEQTQLIGQFNNGLHEFQTGLIDKCNEILDGEDGIAGQVNTAGTNIVAAVNNNKDGGEGEGTAYDAVVTYMEQWQPGTYDEELATKIQTELDQLQAQGIYIGNWEVINAGKIDTQTAEALKKIPAATDWQPKVTVEATLDTTGVVITSPAVDPTPIANAVKDITITVPDITVPEIEVPEAKVTVTQDLSALDAPAAALAGAGNALSTSAANLDTSADNLTKAAGGGERRQVGPEGFGWSLGENSTITDKDVSYNAAQVELGNPFAMDPMQLWELQGQGVDDLVEPIEEDTTTSYYNLAAAFNAVTTALTGGGEEGTQTAAEGEAAGGGLIGAMTTLRDLFSGTLSYAQQLGSYLENDFIASTQAAALALAVVTTDEEGNTDAGGGNTLYTAMGTIYKLFSDTYVTATQLGSYWKGQFVQDINTLKTSTGPGVEALQSLQSGATGAKDEFHNLDFEIQQVIESLKELEGQPSNHVDVSDPIQQAREISANTSKSGRKRASGGPVRWGETYLVGEEGPELFTPARSGYIVPNNELAERRDAVTVNIGNVYGESYLEDYVLKAVAGTVRRELRLA